MTPSAGDRERAVGGVDLDAQVLVRELVPLGAHRGGRAVALDRVGTTRHPKPGTRRGATITSRTGARRWRMAMVAPASPSASSCSLGRLEVDAVSPGAASWNVNSSAAVGSVRCSTRAMRAPASSGPRIISSTQRIFWPTTTVEKPSPVVVVRTTCVGHGGAVVERDQVHRTGAGQRDADDADRGRRAVGFTTMVDAGGRVDGGRRACRDRVRVRPSPTWRASW